jgi:hypothetical protein
VFRDCRECRYSDYDGGRRGSYSDLVANTQGLLDAFSCEEVTERGLGVVFEATAFHFFNPYPTLILRHIAGNFSCFELLYLSLDADMIPSLNWNIEVSECYRYYHLADANSTSSFAIIPPGLIFILVLIE